MNQPVQPPKFSTTRLILTVGITAIAIIFAGAMLIRNKSIENKPALHINTTKQVQPEAAVKMPAGYFEALEKGFLQLDSLTERQAIETISKYHHIPVIYRSENLGERHNQSFRGQINLNDSIINIITMLNHLDFHVSYDGKKIIAGK